MKAPHYDHLKVGIIRIPSVVATHDRLQSSATPSLRQDDWFFAWRVSPKEKVLDSVIAAEVNSRLWSSQMYIALLGQFSDLVPLCRLSTTTIAVREGKNGSVLLKAP